MYPAANPDPPLLAAVAALICALGGLGQGAQHRGAAAMAGGAPLLPLRPSRHPAQPCAPLGARGRGAQPGTGGASHPSAQPRAGIPGSISFSSVLHFYWNAALQIGLCLGCVWFLSALKCFTAGDDLGGHI